VIVVVVGAIFIVGCSERKPSVFDVDHSGIGGVVGIVDIVDCCC